jgi:signal transduction histidine kinase
LDNAASHAGPEARAYVLLEDLGHSVAVSIRDDGVGIPEGRLAQAEAEGRMGVSKSILGRVQVLGGTAVLQTGPGEGTEWEINVPKGKSERG